MSTCKYISPYACHRYTYRSRHVPTIAFSIRFPAATRSPDPPVWPRSGVMILPTSLRIYILSQLYRPLLVVTFRSRSFICMFHVWSAYRYMYLDVDRGSAFWAKSPASSYAQYRHPPFGREAASRYTDMSCFTLGRALRLPVHVSRC